ncbi:hypothetical protein BJF95_04685 [Rhizobium oryziradicis]|uniref:Uncharacterized protein n=2 Tax=Rhizobium oryziradicis TaxID=1867956 RepID=A0A1Q8ZS30_9HYPH|nr:hypothetical protein BJF95_04685 [Rhizobium oryziradicis]
MIMAASGIEFTETTEYEHFLSNVSGAILTKERVLMINQARDYFQESLAGILHLETAVTSMEPLDKHVRVNGELFDYVIDATWGHFLSIPRELYFEPTMLLYYEAMDHHPAVTLVDGSLCSVYPTEDPSIFTLSSVAHTPLGGFTNANQARACINSVDSVLIREKQTAMENQMMRYLPQFCESFQFKGVQLAIKTKPVGMEDDRSCAIYRNDRIFSVLSGKIDTIFYATERILSSLEGSQLFSTPRNVSIRNDIVAASSRQAGARIASSNKKNLAQDA